jgi:hypothetical protein
MGFILSIPPYQELLKAWHWFRADNASRTSVLLMIITGFYAYLTWKMARSIAQQTKALAQPVLKPEFKIDKEEFYPKGSFYMKNIGTQPLLILDTLLTARRDENKQYMSFDIWNENLLPPSEYFGFDFDFTEEFKKLGYTWWTPGISAFLLEIVTSDLSKRTVITYKAYSTMQYVGVEHGMPWRLRSKNFRIFVRSRFYRVYYRIRPPRYFTDLNKKTKRHAHRWAWLEGISIRLGFRSRGSRPPTL